MVAFSGAGPVEVFVLSSLFWVSGVDGQSGTALVLTADVLLADVFADISLLSLLGGGGG